MDQSRVVVFGYGRPAVVAMDALTRTGARLVALVVPSNRAGHQVDLAVAAAAGRQLPVWTQPRRSALGPFLAILRAAAPDVIVVWSYSMLLTREILDIPPRGTVNVHAGVLPAYRGGHVIQWAIINGELETGATLHYVDEGIDTGPVIAESRFAIEPEDDALVVRDRLEMAGAGLLARWWAAIAAGTAPRTPQNESAARYWPLRTPEQGRIDWTRPASEICRLVRALRSNQPGAYVEAAGRIVTLLQVNVLQRRDESAVPGQIASAGADGVIVAAGEGQVLVTKACVDGGPALQGQALTAIAELLGQRVHV